MNMPLLLRYVKGRSMSVSLSHPSHLGETMISKLKSEWNATPVRNRWIVCVGLVVVVVWAFMSFGGVNLFPAA